MAFDEKLADRVRDALPPHDSITERKMFGGIAFMIAGNMCCGVLGDDLIVRLGNEEGERALAEPHTRPFDFTGRPMKSTLYVSGERLREDPDLSAWVGRAVDFCLSLPPKGG